MKKLILLPVLLLTMIVSAQDFVGENVELLEGREIKVMKADEFQKVKGYAGFYTDEKLSKVYKKKDLYTRPEAVEGQVFKVVSYKPGLYGKYTLQLENSTVGKLYYNYDSKSFYDFVFEVVGKLDLPEDFYCKYLNIKEEFNKTKVAYEYYKKVPAVDDIIFTGPKNGYGDKILMNVMVSAKTEKKETLKGIKIFLENEILEYPEEMINAKPGSDGKYDYSAGFFPTEADMQKMARSKITSIQVGPHSSEILHGKILMHFVKCLVKNR